MCLSPRLDCCLNASDNIRYCNNTVRLLTSIVDLNFDLGKDALNIPSFNVATYVALLHYKYPLLIGKLF